jgi:N-acetylglucosamine kinase-like BadF-type ATPase
VSAGGFGPQFGDEGSGYWIGREAVAAVLRAGEGTGRVTRLSEDLPATLNLATMKEILRRCDRSGHVPAPMVAAYAPVVARAAVAGDAVARGILARAGRLLGELVIRTVTFSGRPKQAVPLVLTGGLFHLGGLLMRPLRRALRTAKIRFLVFPPVPDPIQGIIRAMDRVESGG